MKIDRLDIIAFVHNSAEQRKFSEADIPPKLRELLKEHEHEHGEGTAGHHEDEAEGKHE